MRGWQDEDLTGCAAVFIMPRKRKEGAEEGIAEQKWRSAKYDRAKNVGGDGERRLARDKESWRARPSLVA